MDRVNIEPTHGYLKTEVQTPRAPARARSNRDEQNALDKTFNAAMEKFLDERQADKEMKQHIDRGRVPPPQPEGRDVPDVDMESVVSEPFLQRAEYDPDDLWIPELRKLQVATIGDTSKMLPRRGSESQRSRR